MDCNYRREVEATNVAGYFDHYPDFHRVLELPDLCGVVRVLSCHSVVLVHVKPKRPELAFPWEL